MGFSSKTKNDARYRQDGVCGVCGRNLDACWEEAHHILRQADGGNDGVGNCVILCDTCHYRVHNDGRFKSYFTAPRGYFIYLKGPNKV